MPCCHPTPEGDMNVGELIEKLNGYDPSLTVCVDGYEDGVTEKHVTLIEMDVVVDANPESYNGEHEPIWPNWPTKPNEDQTVKRVLTISRRGDEAWG